MIKSGIMRGAGRVARMGDRRFADRLLVGIPKTKRRLRSPRHRWEIILKWIFKMWDGDTRTGLNWLRIRRGGRR